ncbi:uncharacterized protein At1g76660-like isoform X2 [Impatiens glandulifera]|uniref:uncharacterized protein At1g76660-like isoform X2 n=1 Tax=Impatiens glandulifera TaxID=253017 RepID=UPI001FB12627|nr:uncharacterized protein At1g76660-like isoform X2 [Impatiens glandulifera]
MDLDQNRIHQAPATSRRRWGGCLSGLSCFGKQKGGTRIVPSSRVPEANNSANHPQNAPQNNNAITHPSMIVLSLLAPPSSPASYSNSTLPSTAQSPRCFLSLSANSPGGPSSAMFATGPYANDTQLVSPPVFSTFTTQPSTAPLTPPPELAHITTPSSPDVPFARFLSSSNELKRTEKPNNLQLTYSLYSSGGSPSSSLVSPGSGTPRDGLSSNFFCPATFAQFYLDNSTLNSGGRISVSKESDGFSNSYGNVHQNKQGRNSKQDMEEIEAYRASFGFSADEIISTPHYVEIADVNDDEPFTMMPFNMVPPTNEGKVGAEIISRSLSIKTKLDKVDEGVVVRHEGQSSYEKPEGGLGKNESEEDIFCGLDGSKNRRKYHFGKSCSDAEVDYRRGRRRSSSLREGGSEEFWLA